jgi:hypothetical protein
VLVFIFPDVQTLPTQVQQNPSPEDFVGSRSLNVNVASLVPGNRQETVDEMPLASPPNDTVIFRSHIGEQYVWPIESCRSFDVSCPLVAVDRSADRSIGGQTFDRRSLRRFTRPGTSQRWTLLHKN